MDCETCPHLTVGGLHDTAPLDNTGYRKSLPGTMDMVDDADVDFIVFGSIHNISGNSCGCSNSSIGSRARMKSGC